MEAILEELGQILWLDLLGGAEEDQSVATSLCTETRTLLIIIQDIISKALTNHQVISGAQEVLLLEEGMTVKINILIAKGLANFMKHILRFQTKGRDIQQAGPEENHGLIVGVLVFTSTGGIAIIKQDDFNFIGLTTHDIEGFFRMSVGKQREGTQ